MQKEQAGTHCRAGHKKGEMFFPSSLEYLRISFINSPEVRVKSKIRGKHPSLAFSTKLVHNRISYNISYTSPAHLGEAECFQIQITHALSEDLTEELC